MIWQLTVFNCQKHNMADYVKRHNLTKTLISINFVCFWIFNRLIIILLFNRITNQKIKWIK